MSKPTIGFIGQGWIGRNYADDFERRGYSVVRYALEEPYRQNGREVAECDIVFIAVPTPTNPDGFDDSIVRSAVKSVGAGKTAVIKSTILPGTTDSIQAEFPDVYVMHSPEFLTEATAARDAAEPLRNIVGIPVENDEYRRRAQAVLDSLPKPKFEKIMPAKAAELVKYGGNNWFFCKVIYINLLYDLSLKLGVEWDTVREAMALDPRIGASHMMPVHKSGTLGGDAYQLKAEADSGGGRGACGHCFIKDFAAFAQIYGKLVNDPKGVALLEALRDKNIDLLLKSGKDLELLKGVYGDGVFKG